MSGTAGGIIFLPLLLAAFPIVGMVVVGSAVAASISAVAKNNERRRNAYQNKMGNTYQNQTGNMYQNQTNTAYNVQTDRSYYNEIRRSGVGENIGAFRQEIAANMNEQMRLNREVSDRMMQEMENDRRKMLEVINSGNPEAYQQYIATMQVSRAEVTGNIYRMQEEFVQNYHAKINESMNQITETINTQYASYLDELKMYSDNIKAKNEKAAKIANDYIEEAKTLLLALEQDYEGNKFSGLQLIDLKNTLNAAIAQYNAGNYEAAIATAKDVSVSTIDEIYRADCKKQEWDNYYSCALSMAVELEAYLNAQEMITEEVKREVEEKTGKHLEEEIVGIRISDYTDTMKNGQSQYDYLLAKTRELKNFLESENVKNASTEQMKDYVNLLNTKLYPAASTAIYKAILNMNNAFTRQNISEEIIDFFEDHNFSFTGYSYDEDKHDGALNIGLSNEVTGEEIVVTLAPELMSNGDVQTKVEINQLKGDETNEERKAYYRESIQKVVVDSTPGAQIQLECNSETRNKLSAKTQLRDKLKI
ncbi:MAG: hypothetical protein II919_04375 [Lachnospiraceae bacterium]|nr:hypothetical protein [Lachnospiraceae bacterium]